MESPERTSAEVLFEAFPEWRSLARRQTDGYGSEYVVVEVTAPPTADIEQGLWIDTRNDEITVEFDHYHQHFDDWAGESGPYGTESALEFVRQVVEERVAVVSWWHDDQWRGSSQMAAGAPLEPWWGKDTCNRVRVRSWRGTFNVDS